MFSPSNEEKSRSRKRQKSALPSSSIPSLADQLSTYKKPQSDSILDTLRHCPIVSPSDIRRTAFEMANEARAHEDTCDVLGKMARRICTSVLYDVEFSRTLALLAMEIVECLCGEEYEKDREHFKSSLAGRAEHRLVEMSKREDDPEEEEDRLLGLEHIIALIADLHACGIIPLLEFIDKLDYIVGELVCPEIHRTYFSMIMLSRGVSFKAKATSIEYLVRIQAQLKYRLRMSGESLFCVSEEEQQLDAIIDGLVESYKANPGVYVCRLPFHYTPLKDTTCHGILYPQMRENSAQAPPESDANMMNVDDDLPPSSNVNRGDDCEMVWSET